MRSMTNMRTMLAVLLTLAPGAALAQIDPSDHVPTARVAVLQLESDAPTPVGPDFTTGVEGTDPDAPDGLPRAWRYLYRPAVLDDGTVITTRQEFMSNFAELVDWGDADWSAWLPYAADPAGNRVTFTGQTVGQFMLFAVQVIDDDGAVSAGGGYATRVAHLEIRDGLLPRVTLCEYYLGCSGAPFGTRQIVAGQPLNFAWRADAAHYGGEIVSYRHGWDLLDPDDPNDPGWAVPPGLGEQNLAAAERVFQEGTHIFTLRVEDDAQNVVLHQVQLDIVPIIPRDMQRELLVIDQINDRNANNWQDADGIPRNDETYRNAYWRFLEAPSGGVDGFDWERDRFDHTDPAADFADVVGYKAVLCYARYYEEQPLLRSFRSEDGVDVDGNPVKRDPYVWMSAYQERGGNFFLVGERSMESFIEASPRYMTPMVFDTNEPDYQGGNLSYITSFGEKTLPDGTVVNRGTLLYPFATAGIATLDWTSPASKYVYARPGVAAKDQRRSDCVGLKALVLDADFRTHHGVGAGAIPDTIPTDGVIDWYDDALIDQGQLPIVTNRFPWRDDEFVDADISPRLTPWAPQACDDPEAPGGNCVEPMFRGVARFDWVREWWWANGDPDWPTDGDPGWWDGGGIIALQDSCGAMALQAYDAPGGETLPLGSARTNGRIFGFLSYKSTANKPGGAADVFWGFDPYRFDHAATQEAVRWVLRSFALNVRN